MLYFVGNRHAFEAHCRREGILPCPPHARHVTEGSQLRGVELGETDTIIFHASMGQLRGPQQVAITEEAKRLWVLRDEARARAKKDDQRLLRSLGFPIVETN